MTAAANSSHADASLLGAKIFDGLDHALIVEILAGGTPETFGQGEYLYRQGQRAPQFFLVRGGQIELTISMQGGGEHLVSHLGPGDHFGETALLTDQDNGLDARALTEVTVLIYDQQAFRLLFFGHPIIQSRLAQNLARRLRLSLTDHAETLNKSRGPTGLSPRHLDRSFLENVAAPAPTVTGADRGLRFAESTIAKQIGKAVQRFSSGRHPVLLSGETGTGRRMIAAEIHHQSPYKNGPYRDLDVRTADPALLEEELFDQGEAESGVFPHPYGGGLLKRLQGGTLTLYNAEYLEPDCQRQLLAFLKRSRGGNDPADGPAERRCRLILICTDRAEGQDGHQRLLPTLYALFADHHFRAAPLRDHRRDIPRLVHYYLRRYSQQYGKQISAVDDQTMGRFINYHWPGNLAELSGVLQRAVLLGENHGSLNPQIILGLPKVEGKWEFNLLQLPRLRSFLASRLFPLVPRLVVGLIFLLVVIALFAGPDNPHDNIGLTLSWVVGWPLLVFSFFFLARTWCSICGLAVPGWLAQLVLKPERPTPPWIRRHSGWIMTVFCILLFWIETTWNAYNSPQLTAWIILSITLGSLFFSLFYQRRVWCRYLCPLGAINALFSMPAIIELRANSQMCANRCTSHLCYHGDHDHSGCPMFRHPFLVDNNRDCILCGQCIKTCHFDSIHLNLRLAPQELWNQESPRLADSVLVVCLAAIVFPFVLAQQDEGFLPRLQLLASQAGLPDSLPLTSAAIFLALILFYLSGYLSVSAIIANVSGGKRQVVAATLGYGMIPLVLGTYMAAHLAILVEGLWLLPANLLDLVGLATVPLAPRPLLSPDTTYALQFLSVFGGLLASLYATHRIVRRLAGRRRRSLTFLLPALLLCLSAIAYLNLL
jgi:CRP-like cAMP-binding protein/polyferredoxin